MNGDGETTVVTEHESTKLNRKAQVARLRHQHARFVKILGFTAILGVSIVYRTLFPILFFLSLGPLRGLVFTTTTGVLWVDLLLIGVYLFLLGSFVGLLGKTIALYRTIQRERSTLPRIYHQFLPPKILPPAPLMVPLGLFFGMETYYLLTVIFNPLLSFTSPTLIAFIVVNACLVVLAGYYVFKYSKEGFLGKIFIGVVFFFIADVLIFQFFDIYAVIREL